MAESDLSSIASADHHAEALREPDRLAAVRNLGPAAGADKDMDFFADWVARLLETPVGLVSLVSDEQLVFPGMRGLPAPWAHRRRAPLSHSFCRYVVATAEPLVVGDARDTRLVSNNAAVPELGVVAYIGVPLVDADGLVLGSLCAIDTVPRRWSDADLETVEHLGRACSSELRLRLALHDCAVERARGDNLVQVRRRLNERTETLLAASQAFTDTVTLDDVRSAVTGLAATSLDASHVSLALLGDDGLLHRVRDHDRPKSPENAGEWATYDLHVTVPTATSARENRLVVHADGAGFDAAHPPPAQTLFRNLGLQACVAAPLPGPEGAIGAVAFGWHEPREVDPVELLTITTMAGYVAQAVTRAGRLAHRVSVAHQMQNAMLTDLPTFPGLRMAARYRPADARERVGGDWYDAIEAPGHSGGPALLASVGDIVGHELAAVNIMAQARSMLRQAACERPDGPTTEILGAFENANAACDVGACGSAVLTRLHPRANGDWVMHWTNAGHPPPILIKEDGTAEWLSGHDFLFGYRDIADPVRHEHELIIRPGSTLILYTDGLVERRGVNIDDGIAAVAALARELRDHPASDIVEALMDKIAHDSEDDTIAFVIQFDQPAVPVSRC